MTWQHAAFDKMADAGYEQVDTYEEVRVTAEARERVAVVTQDRVLDIDTEHERTETQIPIDPDTSVDDVAIGRDSYLYLVTDGELFAYATTGAVGNPWAEGVHEVEALNDSKVVVAVFEDGTVRGYRAPNGLSRFELSAVRDASEPSERPEIVAGRDRFVTYSGATLRSFDDRGSKQFETTFDSPIRTVGFISDFVLVGLASDRVLWIEEDGEQRRSVDQALETVADCGERLLFGVGGGEVAVFGRTGIVQTVVDSAAGGIAQTSRDSYASVSNDARMHLFGRRSPSTEVSIESARDGPTLVVDAENPFCVSLPLEIDVTYGNESRSATLEMPPKLADTAEISLPNLEAGDRLSVWVGSGDGSMVAYEDEIVYRPSDDGTRPTTPAVGDESSRSDDSDGDEVDPESTGETGSTAGEADEKSAEVAVEHAPSNVTDTPAGESSTEQDDDQIDQPPESASAAASDEPEGDAEELDPGSDGTESAADTEEATAEDASGLSVSCTLERVQTGSYEWRVSVENVADEPLDDVTLEARRPIKFRFTDAPEVEVGTVRPGEKISKTASCPRSGKVEAAVTWTDPSSGQREEVVESQVPSPELEVETTVDPATKVGDSSVTTAGEGSEPVASRVEFCLHNPLSVPIHDQVLVDTRREDLPKMLGRQSITLSPGDNYLSVAATEDIVGESVFGETFVVTLYWLGSDVEVTANRTSEAPDGNAPSLTRDVFTFLADREGSKEVLSKRHVDESRTRPPSNVLLETGTVRNDADGVIPQGELVSTRQTADGTEAVQIPPLRAGDEVEFRRYRQYFDGQKSVNVTVPEYELRGYDESSTLPEEHVQVELMEPLVRAALVRLGLDREPALFVSVINRSEAPLTLSRISLQGTSVSQSASYQIPGQRNKHISIPLPDEFEPGEFQGVVDLELESSTRTFERKAVARDVQDPPIKGPETWFTASVEPVDDGNRIRVTIANETERPVSDVTVSPATLTDAANEPGAFRCESAVSKLQPGQSLSQVRPVDAGVSELGQVLRISATSTNHHVSTHLSLRPRGEEWTCAVVPTQGNVDVSALFDQESWPRCVTTEWQRTSGRRPSTDVSERDLARNR